MLNYALLHWLHKYRGNLPPYPFYSNYQGNANVTREKVQHLANLFTFSSAWICKHRDVIPWDHRTIKIKII
jgi:hypothetical protein